MGFRRLLPSFLVFVLTAACVTPGPRDAQGRGSDVDLRAEEMGDLFARIDEARSRNELPALQAELDAIAADQQAWSVVRAALVRRHTDPDGAWAHLREVTVTTGGRGGAAYWALLGMADISLGWEIRDQARLQIEQALAIAPGSAPALARAGLLAYDEGDVDGATALLRQALDAQDGPRVAPAAAVALARIELAAGGEAAARGHLEAVLAHHPHRVDALVMQAELSADPAESAEFLARAVEAAPRDVDLKVRLAEHLTEMGEGAAALAAWQAVTRHRPEDIDAWRRQASVAAEINDLAAEMEALGRVVIIDDGEIDALYRLAYLQTQAGESAAAAATYEDLLYRRPDDVSARLARARLQIEAENLRGAIGDLRAVLRAGEAQEAATARLDAAAARTLLAELSETIGLLDQPIRGRSPDAIYASVSRVVQRVYERRLEDRPALGGTYAVKVAVRDGAVIDAEVVEDTLHDPILDALIFWTVHDARFPASDGVQEFTLPFTLAP